MDLSFPDHPLHVDRLIQAALEAADPAGAVHQNLLWSGQNLKIGRRLYNPAEGRLFLIGAGKAALSMGTAAAGVLGDTVTHGVLIYKDVPDSDLLATDTSRLPASLETFAAGHPLSDQPGFEATSKIIDLLSETREGDLVLCLISGGASALLTNPLIDLEDWQHLVQLLLAGGCTINELNAVRKRLDRVKGGGLARLAAPAAIVTLILSDVVGNPLDVIGSGPTVPNPDPPGTAHQVLRRYKVDRLLRPKVWSRINRQLRSANGEIEAPWPDVNNIIIGDLRRSAEAAVRSATEMGFEARLLSAFLEGEAREVGRVVAALAKDAPPYSCLVLGGETTVTVQGDGLGGRNLELALAASISLEGWTQRAVATFASDGDDGPTKAAGAIVTGATVKSAREVGIEAIDYLERNDSYHFFHHTGGLLITGPTETNVNDLIFILTYRDSGAQTPGGEADSG